MSAGAIEVHRRQAGGVSQESTHPVPSAKRFRGVQSTVADY